MWTWVSGFLNYRSICFPNVFNKSLKFALMFSTYLLKEVNVLREYFKISYWKFRMKYWGFINFSIINLFCENWHFYSLDNISKIIKMTKKYVLAVFQHIFILNLKRNPTHLCKSFVLVSKECQIHDNPLGLNYHRSLLLRIMEPYFCAFDIEVDIKTRLHHLVQ